MFTESEVAELIVRMCWSINHPHLVVEGDLLGIIHNKELAQARSKFQNLIIKLRGEGNKTNSLDDMDSKGRKEHPIATGVMDYFPDAIAALANVSFVGNEQHNPGEPLRWAREKSGDHADCLMRHFMSRGKMDSDKTLHTTKMVWRGMAMLQLELENKNDTI